MRLRFEEVDKPKPPYLLCIRKSAKMSRTMWGLKWLMARKRQGNGAMIMIRLTADETELLAITTTVIGKLSDTSEKELDGLSGELILASE